MVALLPPSCAATRKSLQHAQAEVEALKNGDQVLWMIVWQDELPSDDLSAARQACGPVADEHTFYFYDNEWLAGRSFADGTVLTGHLTRAFLFYPPGTLWGEQPPEPSAWVHSMGRVGTENRGDADRLTEALRWQWNLLARPR